jgi:hypothetical protein
MFGRSVDALEGDFANPGHVAQALNGCHAVHVSLPTESELLAVEHLIHLAKAGAARDLSRISWVSGTSVREENRWIQARKGGS